MNKLLKENFKNLLLEDLNLQETRVEHLIQVLKILQVNLKKIIMTLIC